MHTANAVGWPVAGQFVDALARRDFAALSACLEPDVRFRALVPPGPFELAGADATIERFRRWFDGPDDFDVADASIGQVGPRAYLRWRVRMRSMTGDRIVEQHAFARIGQRIEELDLLCSGFCAEPTTQ